MYPTTRPFRRNPALRDLTPSALVALVLAGEAQRKFGGDSLAEFVRNAEAAERARR